MFSKLLNSAVNHEGSLVGLKQERNLCNTQVKIFESYIIRLFSWRLGRKPITTTTTTITNNNYNDNNNNILLLLLLLLKYLWYLFLRAILYAYVRGVLGVNQSAPPPPSLLLLLLLIIIIKIKIIYYYYYY